jgi:murein DD-endopeptidase MepM/ murein hydrolase activator NlpD
MAHQGRGVRRVTSLLHTLALLPFLGLPGSLATAADDVDPVGQWPLRPAPEVVEGFDRPSSEWGPGHRGVDLLGAPGQPVRAALPGTVSFVGVIAGRGVVTVDHGDTRTTYEPVASTLQVGTTVGAGDELGGLTFPGSHCAPRTCLHWGWLRGDTYLDPLGLVGAGPVRLLPLDGSPVAAPVARAPLPTPYVGWSPLLHALRAWLP